MTRSGVAVILLAYGVAAAENCLQPELLFNVTPWIPKYQHICCQVPQKGAEHFKFLQEPTIRLFERLSEMKAALLKGDDSSVAAAAGVQALGGVHARKTSDGDVEFVFYDSQCGLPLFVAPRGRSLEELAHESEHHGYPSFRTQEVVMESIELRSGGELVSRCPNQPTHLGHLYVDGKGDQYCVDLMCVAGKASETADVSSLIQEVAAPQPVGSKSGRGLHLISSVAESEPEREVVVDTHTSGAVILKAGAAGTCWMSLLAATIL